MWSAGWTRIPEKYLRTLGLEDAQRFHQQVSPADRLGRRKPPYSSSTK